MPRLNTTPIALIAVLLLAAAEGVSAQRTDRPGPASAGPQGPPRLAVGGGFWYAEPAGEFGLYVDGGFGVDLNGRFAVDRQGIFSLRADLGFVQYGRETRRVCFSATVGCLIQLDLTTSNDIFVGGFGPELAIPGRAVRPYLFGTIGFAYFSTRSSLESTDGSEEIAETQNFGDGTLSWISGGGIEVRLGGTRHPVHLDLGLGYHANGEAQYLREGDIERNPDGSVALFPNLSETSFTTIRLGVRVGVPIGAGADGEPPS